MGAAKSSFTFFGGSEVETSVNDPLQDVTDAQILTALAETGWHFGFTNTPTQIWLRNAARLYRDTCHNLEYAGPEQVAGTDHDDGRGQACYEEAGMYLLAWLAAKADRGRGRTSPVTRIMKANSSRFGRHGPGYHLSASMPLSYRTFEEVYADFVEQLLAYQVSSQIILGAGVVLEPNQSGNVLMHEAGYDFAIGARANLTTDDSASSSSSGHEPESVSKPVFITRDERLGDGTADAPVCRIQTAGYDSNILMPITQLKFDLHLLLAEMVAHWALKPILLLGRTGELHAARVISRNWQARVPCQDGRELTALQIQNHYLEQAQDYVERFRHGHGQSLVDQWRWYLRRLETAGPLPTGLYGHVDWVTKAVMVRRYVASRRPRVDPFTRAELGHFAYQSYGFSDRGLCVPMRLNRRHVQQVWTSLKTPPSVTRAAARGWTINAICDDGVDGSIGWSEFRHAGNKVIMHDGSSPTNRAFEQFQRQASRR